MFEGQSPKFHLHPYLRQLCLSMPSDKVSKKCITISRRGKSYSSPSERGGEAYAETSASGADVMVRVRLEEPEVFWIIFLVLVILRFLPAATSARVGAL